MKSKIVEFISKHKSSNNYVNIAIILFSILFLAYISYSFYSYFNIYKEKNILVEKRDEQQNLLKTFSGMKLSTESKNKDLEKRIRDEFLSISDNIDSINITEHILDKKTSSHYVNVSINYHLSSKDEMKELVASIYMLNDVYKILSVNSTQMNILIKNGE